MGSVKTMLKKTYSAYILEDGKKKTLKKYANNQYGFDSDNFVEQYYSCEPKEIRDICYRLPYREIIIVKREQDIETTFEDFLTIVRMGIK